MYHVRLLSLIDIFFQMLLDNDFNLTIDNKNGLIALGLNLYFGGTCWSCADV